MARRFIVNSENILSLGNEDIKITGEEVKHIQVLRHNVGENIILNDSVYKILKMERDNITLRYIKKADIIGVPNINVTLYIAMLKGDKMDFVIQKAVELGVKRIVPFFSENTVVKLDEKGKIKRQEKFKKVAVEACKQCGRMDSVEVINILNFSELLNDIKNNDENLFAYEAATSSLKLEINNIKENNFKNIGIIIGAEGGFTPKEAEQISKIENTKCLSLGSRILRAETAVISLISVVMYEMGEM